MYPEDIAALFASIPLGAKVRLINELIKVVYADGKLVTEVHPPVDDQGQTLTPELEVMTQKLRRALGGDFAAIDWDLARQALEAATGRPTVVGLRAHSDPTSASAHAKGPATQ